MVARLSDGARRALDRFFDGETPDVYSALLESGLGLYHDGEQYARETDRRTVAAYLSVVARKCSPGALPPVTTAEVAEAMTLAGSGVTDQEVKDLCRALGLRLDDETSPVPRG